MAKILGTRRREDAAPWSRSEGGDRSCWPSAEGSEEHRWECPKATLSPEGTHKV